MPKRIIMSGDDIKKTLKENLMHYYNFDNNAQDSIGGINGILSNVSFSETEGVKVAKFNGSNSKIEFPSPIMVQGNGIRTVNVWLKPNCFTRNPFGLFGANGSYLGFNFEFPKSDQFYIWHGVGDVGLNIATIGLNMWTYRFYGGLVTNADLHKNGVYVGKVSLLAGRDGNMNTQPTYNILGHRPKLASWDLDGGYYFDGDIGYFGVWNRLLTDDEIIGLYNKGKGLKI